MRSRSSARAACCWPARRLGARLTGRIGSKLRMIVAGGERILEKLHASGGDVFRHRPVLRSVRLDAHVHCELSEAR